MPVTYLNRIGKNSLEGSRNLEVSRHEEARTFNGMNSTGLSVSV